MGRGAAGPMLERLGRRDAQWLLLMSLTLFAVLLPSFSYIAALSLIKEEWDLNNTQAGAIISAGLGAYAVAALVLIPMTDRLGPKRILLPAVAVSVAANVLFPLVARGMVTASLVQAAVGVGLAGTYMPGARVVSERFAAGGRGMAIGLFVTAFYAANSVSLVATGSLMGSVDWRDAYLVVALASTASVPMAYLALRDHRQDAASSSSGRLSLGVLGVRRVRYFVFGYTLHTAELFTARAWFPAFLVSVLVARGSEADGAAATAATVAGLVMAAGAVGPVMGGMISDRLGRVASASAIFALSGACSWAIGWMGGLPWGLIVGRRRGLRVGDGGGLGHLHHRRRRGGQAAAPGLHPGGPRVRGLHGRGRGAQRLRRRSRRGARRAQVRIRVLRRGRALGGGGGGAHTPRSLSRGAPRDGGRGTHPRRWIARALTGRRLRRRAPGFVSCP